MRLGRTEEEPDRASADPIGLCPETDCHVIRLPRRAEPAATPGQESNARMKVTLGRLVAHYGVRDKGFRSSAPRAIIRGAGDRSR